MENSPSIIGAREAINAIGATLTAFLKSGSQYPNHLEETYADISKSVREILPSIEAATASYEQACKDFLDSVIQVRGMPFRAISGSDEQQAQNVSSSGSHIAEIFDTLLPSITERYKWCIENYRSQSASFLEDRIGQLQAMLKAFLDKVPNGGTNEKTIKSKIAEIKSDLRSLAKWDRLFYTYKATSFHDEIEYIFMLAKDDPVAAIWEYCYLDEQGEYQQTYNHKKRHGRVYAVRGSWAIEQGFIKVGPAGYLDEISRPGQEVGCMCSLQWVMSPRDLPREMLAESGRGRVNT
ncbi:MAG: hypothetical protein HKL91_02865 [Candidatus Eremiobacteraeota bacterium]|nr:hypothetical protein [Candidatus Eremiobacteraeota bacterium]